MQVHNSLTLPANRCQENSDIMPIVRTPHNSRYKFKEMQSDTSR